jgi:hypothetical protein
MRLQVNPMGIPPPMTFPPNATAEERQKLITQRNQQLQEFYREQTRKANLMQHTYVLVFADDGSFKAPNVDPGTYMVQISLTDARQPNNYRQIGNLNTQVTVPEGNGPHDLGTFQLILNP